jgi:hypothetical protein
MKKRPKCNFENQDNNQFCQNCGTPLSDPTQSASPPNKEKWYQRTAFTVIMLILFFPVGLVLMWVYRKNWKMAVKVIVSAIFALAVISSVFGDDSGSVDRNKSDNIWPDEITPIDDFDYYIDGDSIYITKYKGDSDKVYIGSKYSVDGGDFTVSALRDGTFLFSDVESVIIDEGITSLDDNTFNSCDVKYLYLPSTLEPKESSFWNYFHDVEEIYYGGSNEQWNEICQVSREDLDVKQIYCNVSMGDLGTDKVKAEKVKMSSDDKAEDGEPIKEEQEEQNPEDKFVSDSSEYISENIARKLYGIIVNDIGFSDVEFVGKEASDSVWNIYCDDMSVLAVASDDVYRIWSGDYTFYENGTVITTKQQMEETLVRDEDKTSYYAISQEVVLQYLKNPDSASFPFGTEEIGFEKNEDVVAVQGYVEATNSFGGQVRSQWTVEFRVMDLDSLTYELLYVNIDGEEAGTYTELN